MEFGVDLDQTSVYTGRREMIWNFHENPRHIFYRGFVFIQSLYGPCKKCDMDSHGNFMSQIDGSLVEIDIKFHEYSRSVIQVLFVFHAGT